MTTRGRAIGTASVLIALTAFGCAEPINTEPRPRPELSVGEELYLEMCNRIAQSAFPEDQSGLKTRPTCQDGAPPPPGATAQLQALHAQRPRFIAAVDAAVGQDPALAADLRELLESMLPLYDEGVVPEQTRALADTLTRLHQSPDALETLARLSARQGYLPPQLDLGLLKPLVTAPAFAKATALAARAVGPEGGAHQAWTQWLRVLEQLARHASTALRLAPETAAVVEELLLTEHAELGGGAASYVVRRDRRGLARATLDANPAVPFVDANGDNLADVNDTGRFLGADGEPLAVPPPFPVPGSPDPQATQRDAFGRAQSTSGGSYYEYINTSRTLLGALFAEGRALLPGISGDALADMHASLVRLLGPRVRQQYTFADGASIDFNAYALEQSPLMDVAHVLGQLGDEPFVYWQLRLLEKLLQTHEHEVAGLAQLAHQLGAWLRQAPHADAHLEANHGLAADLFLWLEDVARVPGLLEQLLQALHSPQAQQLGEMFGTMMAYRDPLHLNPNDINAPATLSFKHPVDRHQPDHWDNRSILQRFLHLVHDTNGVTACNKEGAVLKLGPARYPLFGDGYSRCELLQIDNLAVFYIRSLVGRAELSFGDPVVAQLAQIDALLEATTGIDGMTQTPTHAALNRLVFGPSNTFIDHLLEPPKTRDGYILKDTHPHTIFITEWNGFAQAMAPLIEAFSDHGREDLLADLLSTLHLHYSTPGSNSTQAADAQGAFYAYQTGLRRFEGVLAEALDPARGDAMAKVRPLIDAAFNTEVDGVRGDTIMAATIRRLFLPERNPGLTYRDGSTTTTLADGTTLHQLSPVWMLKDALGALAHALPGSDAAVGGSSMHLLTVQETGTGQLQFAKQRLLAAARLLIRFAYQRIEAHAVTGDLTAWSASLPDTLEAALTHPLTGASLHLMERLSRAPELAPALDELANQLHASTDDGAGADALLVAVADSLQYLDNASELSALLEAAAPALTPESGLVSKSLELLRATHSIDQNRVLPRLLAGLLSAPQGAPSSCLDAMMDAFATVNRATPGSNAPLQAADHRAILRTLAGFLTDETRGLERFFELVAHR